MLRNHSTFNTNNIQIENSVTEENLVVKTAANFIEDGDIIFIDSEATMMMFPFISSKKLTVITNHLDFIIKCLPYEI